jgi:hypothetical protein
LAIGLSAPAGAKTQDPTKAGVAWLKALFATGSANEAQTAVSLTAAGSPANAYTVHQIGYLKAQAGSGGGGTPSSVKPKGAKVQLCQKNLSGNTCFTFGRFKVDRQGRVKTFSYIDGKNTRPLDPPILGTGQSGGAYGVTFKLASYFRARDSLIVILDATGAADGAHTVESYQATYQPPSGPAIQAGSSLGLSGDIQPGVAATLALSFPGTAAPGGTITIPMLSGPPGYSNGTATIPLQ